MEDAALFSIISKCFAPIDKSEWEHLTHQITWENFLTGVRRTLQDEKTFGCPSSAPARRGMQCPLQDSLSADEVHALYAPPSYEEKQQFAARHFTGGLSEAVLPVESLFVAWSTDATAESPFSHRTGWYRGDSARYMEQLVACMGMEVPPEYAACPDHVALELDLLAVLLRSGMVEEAQRFLIERFEWLTAWRVRLLQLQDDARFYVALIDVILGIRAGQISMLQGHDEDRVVSGSISDLERKQLCQNT